jgi:DNA polymerase delta subunit 2
VAFISGLEIGLAQDMLSLEMLQRFLRGETGSQNERQMSSQIVRLIVCGNSTVSPEAADQVQKGSYGTHELNQMCYAKINDMLDTLELNLEKFASSIPTDIMPGELELSTSFLPQQPLSKCLFPNLQDRLRNPASNLTLKTNPLSF